MSVSTSLFVPGTDSALDGTAGWITGMLSGTAATSLCVIAVATLGLLMLSGRMAIRRGTDIVIGCFLLLGAGTIAAGLRDLGDDLSSDTDAPMPLVIERDAPQPLPPANYDPYAGASLRRRPE